MRTLSSGQPRHGWCAPPALAGLALPLGAGAGWLAEARWHDAVLSHQPMPARRRSLNTVQRLDTICAERQRNSAA
jgi:hypothetical protein